ncbi:MAG: MBL fold metallo-hydrolase [Actinomycetes bacterium]
MSSPASLTFEFIGNACGIFTGREGTRVLCDPWIANGVFEGSWYHYPPLSTTPEDVLDVDAVYVSHLHPDHFDERFFNFDKNIPIIALEHGHNFLRKKLLELGYNNLVLVKDGETVSYKEFTITMFAPFTRNNFHEAEIGNLIDSAMVIECDGVKAFNANDNTPTPETCTSLKQRFGTIDLAMINYNAAGPYPASFGNLSDAEKRTEHDRLLDRNISYMHNLVEMLAPRTVLPFAGAYILGGHLSRLNDFLGTTTWDVCADKLNEIGLSFTEIVRLREHDVLNIETGESNPEYEPLDPEHLKRYIQQVSGDKYPYESDSTPNSAQIIADLETASNRMRERMARAGISSDRTVTIDVDGMPIQIHPRFSTQTDLDSTPRLDCTLDLRLLRRILDRASHWNNAEIGCHVQFNRTPNEYQPDLHTALQFLHL